MSEDNIDTELLSQNETKPKNIVRWTKEDVQKWFNIYENGKIKDFAIDFNNELLGEKMNKTNKIGGEIIILIELPKLTNEDPIITDNEKLLIINLNENNLDLLIENDENKFLENFKNILNIKDNNIKIIQRKCSICGKKGHYSNTCKKNYIINTLNISLNQNDYENEINNDESIDDYIDE